MLSILFGRGRTQFLGWVLGAAAVWAWPIIGRAELLIEVPTLSVAPGATGSFEVTLVATGADLGKQIQGDQVTLDLPSQSFVTFTGEGLTTVAPYLFANPSGYSFAQSDSNRAYITDSMTTTIATASSLLGLLKVSYSVAANAPAGPYSMSLNVDSSDPKVTFLVDGGTNMLLFTPVNGSITVTSAVPEPSSLVLAAVAGVGAIGLGRRLRGRRA